MAGDLASAPMPAATPASANPNAALPDQPPGAPQVMGGIALGMTECQAVRRAGLPGNVNISAGDKGERKVVLTYLTGPWPGIYHLRRRPAEGNRPRAGAAGPAQGAAEKEKAKKPVKNRKKARRSQYAPCAK